MVERGFSGASGGFRVSSSRKLPSTAFHSTQHPYVAKCHPPSIFKICPLINDASSDAKNKTAFATSLSEFIYYRKGIYDDICAIN
jgi:hypothetical protein